MQDDMKDARLTFLFAIYELFEEVLSHTLVPGEVSLAVDREEVIALLLGPKLSSKGSCIHHHFLITLTNHILLLA